MKNRHIRSLIIYLLVLMMLSAMMLHVAATTGFGDVPPESPNNIDTTTPSETTTESDVRAPGTTEKEIKSIDIQTFGKKTYLEGELFDPSGYVLKVNYTDGTYEEIDSKDFEYSPQGRLVTEDNSEDVTVKFSYKGMDKKIYVTVKRPLSLSVKQPPDKMQYCEGESFDPKGLVLSLQYPDGKTRQPDEDEYTVNAPSPLTADVTSVDITCYGKTATLKDITVIKMTAMEISKMPDKIVYYEGEKFDPAGMIVVGTFEGSDEVILLDEGEYTIKGPVDCLAPDSEDRRLLTLTLSAGDVSTKLDLTVYGFESFIVTPPDKTDYYYGDSFSGEGLAVKAKYVNGDEKDITNDITVIAPEIMTAGSEVRIQYLEYEQSILSVHEVRTLKIKNQPADLTFREGSLLTDGNALADMVVTVVYDDGTEFPLPESEYTISPAGALTLDDTELVVSYQGLTARLGITVVPARSVKEIKVTQAPQITEYISNQTIDVTGLEVTVTYEDGTTEVLPMDKLQITPAPGSSVKVTDTRLKIVYAISEKVLYTTYQPIEVSPKRVISLSILTPPAKLQYVEGEKFNTAGMEVLAIYNDGTSAKITTYTFSPSGALALTSNTSEETVGITISYVDCTATQNITVKERQISSMEVARNPSKLVYAPGEKFDPTGLILKVNYIDGTTALVEYGLAAIEFAPVGGLTEDVSKVTLTFRTQTLSLPITVRRTVETEPPVTSGDENTTGITPPDSDPTQTNVQSTGDVTSDTTPGGKSGGKTVIVVWISIIAIIVILLVVLIIYYKRNFT